MHNRVYGYGYGGGISMMAFITLSIVGLLLPLAPLAAASYAVSANAAASMVLFITAVFVVVFVASCIMIRNAAGPGLFAYLFILTAPFVLNLAFSLLAAQIGPSVGEMLPLSGFIGVALSYFYLSGKDWLD